MNTPNNDWNVNQANGQNDREAPILQNVYFEPTDEPTEPDPAPEEPKKKKQLCVRDILLAWFSLAAITFLMEMRAFRDHPLGVLIALTALTVASIAYLAASGVKLKPRLLALEAVSLILSAAIILNGNAAVRGFVIFFFIILTPFRIALTCGLLRGGLLGRFVVVDAIRSYLMLLFRRIGSFFSNLFFVGFGKKLARILLGFAIALIPTLTVTLLLSYDARFTHLLQETFHIREVFRSVWSVILAVPLAMLLFGSLDKAQRIVTGKDKTRDYNLSVHKFSSLILCSAVTPLLFIYVLFFVSQAPYYLSAFTKVLPEELTYAAYAKEGFFQLCAVSGINAVLLMLFSVFTRSEQRASDAAKRIFSALLSVFTLVLIATALSKMVLYISSYGLTQKRVYASWFMLLLAVGFIAVLLNQCFKKLPLAPILVAFAILFSGVLVLPNTDAKIADYNVDAYISATLPEADVVMMEEELGISSVPALVRLYTYLSEIDSPTDEQAKLLEQTHAALARMHTLYYAQPAPALSFSFPRLRAEQAWTSIGWGHK